LEKEVEILFGEQVLNEAARRFGLDADVFTKLGDFENYVYEVRKQGEPCILRLTHSSHREEPAVRAELDWVRYLTDAGVAIPGCIDSLNGRKTEVVPATSGETYFTCVMFEKAAGARADHRNPAVWNTALIREWGRITGHMHRATSAYVVADGAPKRHFYFENGLHEEAERIVGEGEEGVLKQLASVLGHILQLPRDERTFGLIHTDIHQGNFFVDEGRVAVFDFDDSAYTWFVHDLAIPLYYSLCWSVPESYQGDLNAFARDFMLAFWEGYASEHKLDPSWLAHIPAFMKLRDLELYIVLTKKIDPAEMSDRHKKWLAEIRERIERDAAIVELDFAALVAGR